MAIATDSSGRHLPGEPAPAAWSTGGDRARAFASARRHSILVRCLKVLLPISALVVMSSYGIFVQRSVNLGDGKLTVGPVSFSSDVLTMHNPQYEGFSKDGSRFSVSARTAEQDVAQKEPIRLNTIEGSIVQPNKTATTLRATRGVFDNKASELELFDAIQIRSSDGMEARLERAKVFMKESRIVSDAPVTVEMATGTLTGNRMVLLQKTREVTFSDGVAARLTPRDRDGAKTADPSASAQSRMIGASDAPVDVTAPTLVVDDAKKIATFSGDVRAEQDGSVLTSRQLEVTYEGGGGTSSTTAAEGKDAPASATPASGRVKTIVARENVVLTRGNDRVTTDHAVFDPIAETSVLTGSVMITSGPDRQAMGDRADLDMKADTALLTGNVLVVQGKNALKGRRLLVNRKNGTLELSAPPQDGQPAGRISTRFHQPEAKPSKQPTAPDEDGPGLRFRTDPNAPIEIGADVLNVDDKTRTATFRGDVHAVQGEFSIRTVELVATYSGQASVNLMQTDTGEQPKNDAAQLQRVQARRKVVVTSKDDQSATGDWADFDVKANTVVLGGDVTLTQGRNVIRGPRLVIDMTTGMSRMETGKPAGGQAATAGQANPATRGEAGKSGSAPGAQGWPAGNCGGRMCAVFYPKDAKDAAKQGANNAINKARPKQPAGDDDSKPARREADAMSSWSSTTTPAE